MSVRWVEAFPMRESVELCAGMSVGGRGQPFTHSANQRWTWHLVCVPQRWTLGFGTRVCVSVCVCACARARPFCHLTPEP